LVGGYYDSYETYMEFLPSESKREGIKIPTATEDIRPQQAKCVAFPILEVRDIFVEANTNKRYVVRLVKSLSEMRGLPLIYLVTLNELPKTHIVYQVPCALS
jgi:hypothetical protein